MAERDMVVREIDWRSVAPWLLLIRTLPLAASVSIVALGTLGVMAASTWWWLGGLVFSLGSDDWRGLPRVSQVVSLHESTTLGLEGDDMTGGFAVARYFFEPLYALIDVPSEHGLVAFAYLTWGSIGSLAIWSWVGGAISRITLLRLGRDEYVGLKEAARFATRRFPALVTSALYPLAVLIPLALAGGLFGFVMRADLGAAAVACVWGLGLIAALVAAVALLGVWFGWPLMIATVAAEGTDSLDGLSRGFAYSFQRPVHYAFYALVSLGLSIGGIWLATLLATLVTDLTWWSVSWGAGGARIAVLRSATEATDAAWEPEAGTAESENREASGKSSAETLARHAFAAWERVVATILSGFRFALFWALYAGIYLLLRHQVDETEFDELYLEQTPPKPLPDLEKERASQANSVAVSESTSASDKPAAPAEPKPEVEKTSEPDEPVRDE